MQSYLISSLIILIGISSLSFSSFVYDVSEAKKVIDYLESKNLRSETPPVESGNEPLEVEGGMIIHTISDVSARSQTITIVGTLLLSWTDPFLKWNMSEYNINLIRMNVDKIWTPQLKLRSGVEGMLDVRLDKRFDTVAVTNEGKVISKIERSFKSTCDSETTGFPYDFLICRLEYESSQPKEIIRMKKFNASKKFFDSSDATNNEWILQKMRYHTNTRAVDPFLATYGFRVSYMKVELTLSRNPIYYIVLVVVPVLVATVLIPLIPLIPVDSGERLSLVMSFFLSFVLFLLLIDNILPKGSFSSLTISMSISVILILFNLLESILVINYDRRVLTIDNASIEPAANSSTADDDQQAESGWRRVINLKNPKILISRIDKTLLVFNILVVLGANCYIVSQLLPKYVMSDADEK